MKTLKTMKSETNDENTHAGSDCQERLVRHSSDTPETNSNCEVWLTAKPNVQLEDGREISGNVVDADFARKLERQRNAAWNTIKDIRDSVIADETFGATVELLFGKPLEEAEAEIARLNSLLNTLL